MTTRSEISEWFDRGVKEGADFMIVVCDTFDWEDYPVYGNEVEFYDKYDKYNGKDMQKVMEVYDLRKNKEYQMSQRRCFSMPVR